MLAIDLWLLPGPDLIGPLLRRLAALPLHNTQHVGLMDNIPITAWYAYDHSEPLRTLPLLAHELSHRTPHVRGCAPATNWAGCTAGIKDDLPTCTVGLVASWREIGAILEKQKDDPGYQHLPDAPNPGPGLKRLVRSTRPNRIAAPHSRPTRPAASRPAAQPPSAAARAAAARPRSRNPSPAAAVISPHSFSNWQTGKMSSWPLPQRFFTSLSVT